MLSEDADKHSPTHRQTNKEVLVWTLCKIITPAKKNPCETHTYTLSCQVISYTITNISSIEKQKFHLFIRLKEGEMKLVKLLQKPFLSSNVSHLVAFRRKSAKYTSMTR